MIPVMLRAAIKRLRPGERLLLGYSPDGATRTVAERSGDGRVVRFVRETAVGFIVYHTVRM